MDDDDFVFVPSPDRPGKLDKKASFRDIPEHLPTIDFVVNDLQPSLWKVNTFIHEHPELGFEEHTAHDVLTQYLRSRGDWAVTPSAHGMATAWEAVFDTGRPGPTVSFNAEMDALPGLGHACGHNLIAVASVGAAIATAETLRSHRIGGKVVIFGTPAEEGGGGGKIKLLKAGAYDNVNVSIISHPGLYNNSPMVRTTAYTHLDVRYKGKAAHAANAPWKGVNALDAVVVAYNAVSVLRQQLRSDDVVGLQITDGGGRPNVIHDSASCAAVLRAVDQKRLGELQSKVEACFRAGAEATGAEIQIEVERGYKDHVPNRVLAESFARYWSALPDLPDPPLPPRGHFTWVKASTDQGNLSYVLPSINVSFAIPPAGEGGPNHTPDFKEASGTRIAFERAMRVAKGMAGAAVDVCAVDGLMGEVRKQWKRDMDEYRG